MRETISCVKNLKTNSRFLNLYAQDILDSNGMQREKTFIQHGTTSCYEHSLSVACMSIKIASYFRVRVELRSMIRGALLHDYFLYDWHVADKNHRLHGFFHARRALKNAERDFNLNRIERDIIVKHMFPVTLKIPRYRETVIVIAADKLCAFFELRPCRYISGKLRRSNT